MKTHVENTMDNKAYFNYSQTHEDDIVDYSQAEGVLVINKNKDEPETKLMIANHELIESIITYKKIKNKFGKTHINKIVDEIIYLLETVDLINYSSFCTYLQVIGYSYNAYCEDKKTMTQEEKRELISVLLDLYIANRHDIYMYHGYSDQVLQVQSDTASSRRKGKVGIEKMESVLKPSGFVMAETILELQGKRYCYICPDSSGRDKRLFDTFLKINKIKFEFKNSRDNKYPDLLLKIKDDYYIVEHKLTNGGGGSQNAEINEIIQFIGYDEAKKNWHYLSCLQGNYFKKINSKNLEPKAAAQYLNIMTNLKKCPGNYFLNGHGFEKFIKDMSSEPNVFEALKKFSK